MTVKAAGVEDEKEFSGNFQSQRFNIFILLLDKLVKCFVGKRDRLFK